MSEQFPHHDPIQVEALQADATVQTGLEKAQLAGFDLQASVAANFAEGTDPAIIDKRSGEITQTMHNMASDLKLEAAFFDRPANTVLLASIADSWVTTNEKIAAGHDHSNKIVDERAMLVDIALIAAGTNSGAARELAANSAVDKDRYIEEDSNDPETLEREAYLESITDPAAAERLKAVLDSRGSSSLLEKQREMLGITDDNEDAYDVKVLKVGSSYNFRELGLLPTVEWPDYDFNTKDEAVKKAQRAAGEAATAEYERQKEFAQPYEDAEIEYNERFAAKNGELPPAFVNIGENGKKTLFLRAAEAAAITKAVEDGVDLNSEDHSRAFIDVVATARHEYAHTQKSLLVGAHIQMGRILEERKAELVSYDKMGYQDIKYFVTDLSWASDHNILDGLQDALKEPDALSSFMISSAKNMGLRNTLMIMASAPGTYSNGSEVSKLLVQTGAVKHDHDHSVYDTVVRETVDAKSAAAFNEHAVAWANRVLDTGKQDANWLKNDYVNYRGSHGSTYTAELLRQAIDEAEVKRR